ncbi:MAG: hypothetical protein Q8S44_09825 [Flavobacteriaceae bacterium]|nr:hypothetical protein [Flavobacteriaceae bacterium]
MKTTKNLLSLMLVILVFASNISFAQESEQKPVFITITKMHFNLKADGKDWLKTEKEFFDKVTSQNELVVASHVITHLYTADNSEVEFVYVYNSWGDIEKASEVNNKLIEKNFPDEAKRKAFFDKQSSYYTKKHSDEIYQSMSFAKQPATKVSKPQIIYIRKSQMALNGEGKGYNDFAKNVIHKNPLVKAYYPHRHLWGSDSRDFIEVFVFDSLADLEKSADKNQELANISWPDEAKRKEFFEGMNKLFTGKHADYIFQSVPELNK